MSVVQAPGLGVVAAGRWLGLLGGLAVASWLLSRDPIGWVYLLVGPAIGLCLLGGVLLGELAAPGPARGPARRALLETRRVADYLPPAARHVAALVAVYGLVLVVALLARRPLNGGPGELVIAMCAGREGMFLAPWPDPVALVPGLLAVLAGLATAALALHLLARRARPAGVDVADDDRRRRETAAAVVAACAVLVAAALCCTALVLGVAMTGGCGGAPGRVLGWVLQWVAGTAGLIGCWAAAALLLPRRRAA